MASATNIQRIVQIVLRVVDETKGVLGKVAKNFEQVESSTKEAGTASADSAKEVKKLSKELKDTGTQAKQSAVALDKASAATKKLASTKLGKVLSVVQTKLSRVTSRISSYAKSVGTAVSKSSLFAKAMTRIKSSASGMQGSLSGLLGAFTGLAASFGGLIFPITKAAKFERAMSEVKAVSGSTEAQITKLSARASELGRTTEYTGVQSAQAMKMLAMAGLSAEDIFDSVGHVLRVAHAGAVDLGVAADICTNIMTGFRLESSDLARVNDVLVQTFTNTNSTLEELGHAMAYVAPVAAGLGGNFEDLTATVGLLHNAGIKGTMAGTALRGMLFRLFNPTKEEAVLMGKLNDRIGEMGLRIRDTSGDFVGFVSLVEQLESAQVDAAEAMAMFGQRAGPGMAALLGMGSKVLAEYVALNEKAQGRAEEISRVMGQNVVGAFRETKSAVSGLTNAIGKQLLPQVNKLLRGFTEWLNSLTDWIKEHEELTMGVLKVVGAISAFIAIAAALKIALFAIGPAIGIVTKVVSGLVAFFTSGIAIIASFYGAVAALVAFLLGITFSETFRSWVGSLEFFGTAVKDWGTRILAEFAAFWAGMKFGFKSMWLDLKEAVGFDVTAQRAELAKSLHQELALRNQIVESITDGGTAARLEAELQAALKERAVATQEAINKVTAEYEAEIKKVRAAWEDVSKKVGSLRTELDNLISQAQEKLGALAESFSTIISRSFAEAETSAIIDGIKAQIAEVERVYDESDEVRKNKVQELENALSSARIRITASTVKQALGMWDTYGNKQKALLDASLAAQLIAQGEYNQRVNALQQEVLEAKKSACERATEILKVELNKSLAAEEALAAKIKGIQDDIAGFHKSAEEKIRELRRKGMTDEQAYADRVLELNQKLAAARALDPSQYEEAKRLFDEVKGAASGLVGEIKKGDQVLISEHKTISDAIGLIESAESGMVAAGTAAQSVTATRLTEQTKLTDTLASGLTAITKKYEEINTALGKAIQVKVELDTAGVDRDLEKITTAKELYITAKAEFDEATIKLGELELAKVRATEEATLRVDAKFDPKIADIKAELAALETDPITVQATVDGIDDVQALDTAIDGLDSKEVDAGADVYGEPLVNSLKASIDGLHDKTVTITTRHVETHQAGGPVGLFAGGGKLPGFGGGDKIHALLEAGEFVINKKAVRKYGDSMFSAYNNMMAPVKYAFGGFVKKKPWGSKSSGGTGAGSLNDIDKIIDKLSRAIDSLDSAALFLSSGKGKGGGVLFPSSLRSLAGDLTDSIDKTKREDSDIINDVVALLTPGGIKERTIRQRLRGRKLPEQEDVANVVFDFDEQIAALEQKEEELIKYRDELEKVREFMLIISSLVATAQGFSASADSYNMWSNTPDFDYKEKVNQLRRDFERAKVVLGDSSFNTSDMESAFAKYLDRQEFLTHYQIQNSVRTGRRDRQGAWFSSHLGRFRGKDQRGMLAGGTADNYELEIMKDIDLLKFTLDGQMAALNSKMATDKRGKVDKIVNRRRTQSSLELLATSARSDLAYRPMLVGDDRDIQGTFRELKTTRGKLKTSTDDAEAIELTESMRSLRTEYMKLVEEYFKNLPKFAHGGLVDSIIARLSPGEFVLRPEATAQLGLPFLNALNSLQFPVPAYATGGVVGSLPAIATAGPSSTQARDINLSVNITGAGEITEKQVRKWIVPAVAKIRRLEK